MVLSYLIIWKLWKEIIFTFHHPPSWKPIICLKKGNYNCRKFKSNDTHYRIESNEDHYLIYTFVKLEWLEFITYGVFVLFRISKQRKFKVVSSNQMTKCLFHISNSLKLARKSLLIENPEQKTVSIHFEIRNKK